MTAFDEAELPLIPEKGSRSLANPADTERLGSMTELLSDVSNLIDLVSASQKASIISKELTIPVHELIPMQLPVIEGIGGEPEYVKVLATRAHRQTDSTSDSEPALSTSLKVEVRRGSKVAYIQRDSQDQDIDDVIQDETRHIPPVLYDHIPLGMELSGETDEEASGRQTSMPQLSRRELNELLMSLALGNTIDLIELEERGLNQKNLIDPQILTLLIEQMTPQAIEVHTTGTHTFDYFKGSETALGEAELNFDRKGSDLRFTMTISSKDKSGPSLQAIADTKDGLDLRFFVYTPGAQPMQMSPDIDDIDRIRAVLLEEIDTLQGAVTESLTIIANETLIDPEEVAVSNIQADEETLKHLRDEINGIALPLDQNGLDSPDSSAA